MRVPTHGEPRRAPPGPWRVVPLRTIAGGLFVVAPPGRPLADRAMERPTTRGWVSFTPASGSVSRRRYLRVLRSSAELAHKWHTTHHAYGRAPLPLRLVSRGSGSGQRRCPGSSSRGRRGRGPPAAGRAGE